MGARRTCLLTAGCVLALLAGCAGSPATTATRTGGSGTPSSSTKAPPAPSAAQPRLKKIVLQPTDFPPGWKGAPYPLQSVADEFEAAFARCLEGRDTANDKVAQVYSDQYTLGDVSVVSSAASYRSQSDLDSNFAAARSPKFSPCTEQLFRKAYEVVLPAGGTIDSVSVKTMPGRAGGPPNVVAMVTGALTLSVRGRRLVTYVSFALIGGPLVEVEVSGSSLGGPVPAALMESLITKVAARAAAG